MKQNPLKYARQRFKMQECEARRRGINFELSFEEWYAWWLANGVDRNIPRPFNGSTLCMCRHGDTGPYSLTNIYCATLSQNNRDAHQNNRSRGGHKKMIQTPIGQFESRAQAARALGIAACSLEKRMKKKPNQYWYI